jgi:membrane-associated phospholipid phosphatase
MEGMGTPAATAPGRVSGATSRVVALRLAVAAVLAFALTLAVYVVMIRTTLGQRVDDAGLTGSFLQRSSARQNDITALQEITRDSLFVVLVVLAGIGVLRRRPRLGVMVAVTAGASVLVVDALKWKVLTRPHLIGGFLNSNTFPSGHTATAVACALALIVVCPPRWRGAASLVAGTYAWLTAARVQTAGWHRLSDALGGALVAFAVVALGAALLAATRPVGRPTTRRHPWALAVLGVIWVVAVVAGAVDLARVLHDLARDGVTVTPATDVAAYHISLDLTVAVVVTLLAGLLALLSGVDLDEPGRSRLPWRRQVPDAPVADEPYGTLAPCPSLGSTTSASP